MDVCGGFQDNEDQDGDRVTLNVGGVRFETYITTLQNIADTRLAWLTENVEEEALRKREFFFDRHPGAFVYIMNFYRTGKLHTPRDMCGPAFEEELQFWGIDEKQMEPCCWETFTKHREAEGNLKTFEGPGFEDLNPASRKFSTFNSYDDDGCYRRQMSILWEILNDPHSSELAKRFSLLSCCMIIISLSVYCLTTMESLAKNGVLTWINRVCLVFFTLEFTARVIVCPSKIKFIKDYKNWIDLLSIIPTLLLILYDEKWIQNLVIIRLLRVFRFFKLSYGLQVLVHTLKASSYELTLLLLVLLIPLVVFSSLVYASESMIAGNEQFNSIPRTFWWCIITMTTVGYGDITPKTWAGQIIGSICAIIGVLIIALPISVIGNNFTLYYAHVRARLKLPKKNRHLLQGRLRGLLRQPAMLSSRDRDRKTIRRNGSSLFGESTIGDRLTVDHTPSPFLPLRRERSCIKSDMSLNVTESEDPDSSHFTESDQESCGKERHNSIGNYLNGDVVTTTNSHNDVTNDDVVEISCSDQSNEFNKINEEKQDTNERTNERKGFFAEEGNEIENKLHMKPYLPLRSQKCKKKASDTIVYQPTSRPRICGVKLSKSLVALPTEETLDYTNNNSSCGHKNDNFLNNNKETKRPPNTRKAELFPPSPHATQLDNLSPDNDIRRESMQKIIALCQAPPKPPMRTRSKTVDSRDIESRLPLRESKTSASIPASINHAVIPRESSSALICNKNNTSTNSSIGDKSRSRDGILRGMLSPRVSHKVLGFQRKKQTPRRSIDSAYGGEAHSSSEKTLSMESLIDEGLSELVSPIGKESGV